MGDAEIIPIGTRGPQGRGTGTRPSAAARGLAGGKGNGAAKKRPAPGPDGRQPAAPPEPTASTDAGTTSTGPAAHPEPDAPRSPRRAANGRPASGGRDRSSAHEEPRATSEGAEVVVPPAGESGGATDQLAESAESAAPPRATAAAGGRPPVRVQEQGPLAGIPVGDWLAAFQHASRELFGDQWEPQLARMLAFLRRRVTGDYEIDEYGFDQEVTERFFMAALRPIAQKWFRIEVRGVENIPTDGGALVVSNHSGTVPVDGLMTMVSIHDHTGRHLRPLGADLVFRLPVVGALARKGGATLACSEDAERMLRGGELVGVWPEGFKGIGKPFSDRYKLQRFGRGGFVSAALRTGVPIVPLSVVGAEEIYPLVGNVPSLARLLGVPYIPITPLFPLLGPLGLVPLPSKWLLEFGEPIRTDEYDAGAAEDPMLVFDVTDQVRETIQQTLYRLLVQRESVFR
ncbi:1-acyl-sn-glycerol-3-phosphate acyltransferase [Nocardioides sp. SYSU DS0651]|uniref:lysophospholipid acyltransferase family protein n=1 Tax=Nocardioides sp. SYSU DS0651 TaxID=3415955 RepID=UPI003F4BB1B3